MVFRGHGEMVGGLDAICHSRRCCDAFHRTRGRPEVSMSERRGTGPRTRHVPGQSGQSDIKGVEPGPRQLRMETRGDERRREETRGDEGRRRSTVSGLAQRKSEASGRCRYNFMIQSQWMMKCRGVERLVPAIPDELQIPGASLGTGWATSALQPRGMFENDAE
jgi:hypothetical protein